MKETNNEGDVIVSEIQALSIQDKDTPASFTIEREPAIILAEAKKAARALAEVLMSKERKVIMNGEQYLENEDWQTVGKFYGVTAKEEGDPEYVEFGGVDGFKASSVALWRGQVISRATAYCMRDEEKWKSRAKYSWLYVLRNASKYAGKTVQINDAMCSEEDPGPEFIVWEPNPDKPGKKRPKKIRAYVGEEVVPLFQLGSMAQTRANSKVLKNVLSWVVVLAGSGYRTTPAEELDSMAHVSKAKTSSSSGQSGREDESIQYTQEAIESTEVDATDELPTYSNPKRKITKDEWAEVVNLAQIRGIKTTSPKGTDSDLLAQLKQAYGIEKPRELTFEDFENFKKVLTER